MGNARISILNTLVVIFSIIMILSLSIETFFTVNDELKKLMSIFDCIGCFIFCVDIFNRYKAANNKLMFLLKNSIDIAASIPYMLLPVSGVFNLIGYGKMIRLLKILKILKMFKGVNVLINYMKTNKRNSMTLIFVSCLFIFMIAGSSAILVAESYDANANIKTAEHALWWSYITITTVGYGDFYPVTTLGRIIACFLSMGGIGLYGAFTGIIATYFIGEQRNE